MHWISSFSCLFHHSLSDPMGLSSMRISRVRVFKDFFAHVTSGRLIWEMQHAHLHPYLMVLDSMSKMKIKYVARLYLTRRIQWWHSPNPRMRL